jgi:hypothetical protein
LYVEGTWTLRPAVACGAGQVVWGGAQAVSRGGARCASRVLDRGAKAVARDVARCCSQVLDRGAKVVAAAAMLSQQEKNNSADVQRKRENFTRMLR